MCDCLTDDERWWLIEALAIHPHIIMNTIMRTALTHIANSPAQQSIDKIMLAKWVLHQMPTTDKELLMRFQSFRRMLPINRPKLKPSTILAVRAVISRTTSITHLICMFSKNMQKYKDQHELAIMKYLFSVLMIRAYGMDFDCEDPVLSHFKKVSTFITMDIQFIMCQELKLKHKRRLANS